jgi:hypothetical protein
MKKGDYVEWKPHTDLFMRGERYGTITFVGRTYLHITGQRSGKHWIVRPEQVSKVDPQPNPVKELL